MTESLPSMADAAVGSIPWWPADERRGSLSRDDIARAALEILDGEGLAALSMRRLARALDSGTMSLYWYVQGKDQVLALAVDAVLAHVRLPRDDLTWTERVRAISEDFRRAVTAHPAIVPVLASGMLVGPNMLRVQEAILLALRDSGLNADEVVDAYHAIAGLTTSFLFADQSQSAGLESGAARPWLDGYGLDALPADLYPETVALAARLQAPAQDQRFAFGLDALIEGLKARAAKSATR